MQYSLPLLLGTRPDYCDVEQSFAWVWKYSGEKKKVLGNSGSVLLKKLQNFLCLP